MLNALWYLTPVGLEAPFYPILHITALGLILFFRKRISNLLHSSLRKEIILGTAFCSYAAIMADHMTGNLIWLSSINLVIPLQAVSDALRVLVIPWLKPDIPVLPQELLSGIFMAVLPITAIERIICTMIATIIGVALIRIVGWGRLSE